MDFFFMNQSAEPYASWWNPNSEAALGEYMYVLEWSIRSFVLCGQGSSLLWISALRPFELVQCASPG